MPAIGEVIREYRQKAGLTQSVLGEKIGVISTPQARVAEWETGKRTPAAEYLLKIMSVLHIPPEAFDEYKEMTKNSSDIYNFTK